MTKWTACSLADWDMEASLQGFARGQASRKPPTYQHLLLLPYHCRHEAQAECGRECPERPLMALREGACLAECPGGGSPGCPGRPSHAGAAAHSGFCR